MTMPTRFDMDSILLGNPNTSQVGAFLPTTLFYQIFLFPGQLLTISGNKTHNNFTKYS